MAYRFLFAIFPLLLFLAAALGFVGQTLGIDDLFVGALAQAAPLLPADVNRVLDDYVTGLMETRSSAFLTIGIFGTVWGAVGGAGTLIKALDRAYDVEKSCSFWRQQLLSLGLTVTIVPVGLVLLALGVAENALVAWLGASLGLPDETEALAALLR